MTTQTLVQLRDLKLSGMATALEQQLQQVDTFEALPFTERLSLLLEQEHLLRDNRKQLRLIRQARFRVSATVQEIDYQQKRNLKRDVVARLAQGDWIERKQNLLITGPCGSGKTYIACALGHNACIREHSVRYFRLSRLLLELTQAKADGSYTKLLKLLSRTHVLILDDWGLESLCSLFTATTCLRFLMIDMTPPLPSLSVSYHSISGMSVSVTTHWLTPFLTG